MSLGPQLSEFARDRGETLPAGVGAGRVEGGAGTGEGGGAEQTESKRREEEVVWKS